MRVKENKNNRKEVKRKEKRRKERIRELKIVHTSIFLYLSGKTAPCMSPTGNFLKCKFS